MSQQTLKSGLDVCITESQKNTFYDEMIQRDPTTK